MKQNLTRNPVISRFFSVTGMTGQNRHNWPDFFCNGTFFWSLGLIIWWSLKKAVLILKNGPDLATWLQPSIEKN